MAGHGADALALWSEFLLWASRAAGYSTATFMGSWAVLTWLRKRRARRAGGPERRGWRGLARAAGNFWE